MLDGEEAAFEAFFNAVYPALYRFALARLGFDEDAADEVAQAAICKAIAKLHTFRGEAALLTWVCTFCRREIYAYGKRHADHPHVELAEDEPEIRAALESLRAATVDDPGRVARSHQARGVRPAGARPVAIALRRRARMEVHRRGLGARDCEPVGSRSQGRRIDVDEGAGRVSRGVPHARRPPRTRRFLDLAMVRADKVTNAYDPEHDDQIAYLLKLAGRRRAPGTDQMRAGARGSAGRMDPDPSGSRATTAADCGGG